MKLSEEKRKKIAEQVLAYLFDEFPNTTHTAEIARELIRDEEFIKSMLQDLEVKGLVISIKEDSKKRFKWRLSQKTLLAYKSLNNNQFRI
ncbi:MAG: hypothetical protein AABX65_04065 [Nanoarchaeota archaeon]